MREQGPDRHAIVLAGGFGTRLRVFARALGFTQPKQFCRFGGGRSLLQDTLHRVGNLVPGANTTVVVHSSQRRIARRQVRAEGTASIFVQPCDRGTGAAVLYPALPAAPDDLIVVTPADHAFADESAFSAGVHAAFHALEAGQADTVLIGAPATKARSDFGWIRRGVPLGPAVHRVGQFVEKPPVAEAERLFTERALWNTMVMVTRAKALIDLFQTVRPTAVTLLKAARAVPLPLRRIVLRRIYRRIAPIDLSRDVLQENPHRLAVTAWPAASGWDDLGTPERLATWLNPEGASA